jgi:hypothetical protein
MGLNLVEADLLAKTALFATIRIGWQNGIRNVESVQSS